MTTVDTSADESGRPVTRAEEAPAAPPVVGADGG